MPLIFQKVSIIWPAWSLTNICFSTSCIDTQKCHQIREDAGYTDWQVSTDCLTEYCGLKTLWQGEKICSFFGVLFVVGTLFDFCNYVIPCRKLWEANVFLFPFFIKLESHAKPCAEVAEMSCLRSFTFTLIQSIGITLLLFPEWKGYLLTEVCMARQGYLHETFGCTGMPSGCLGGRYTDTSTCAVAQIYMDSKLQQISL